MKAAKEITIITGFKIIGSSDEGQCDRCGKQGLKRTVAVAPCDADGLEIGIVEHWGVCCAAYAKHGKRSVAAQNKVIAEAKQADDARAYELSTKVARIADGLTTTYRVSFPVSHTESVTFCHIKDMANWKYRRTGRNLNGSYFASNAMGHIVRVDGKDTEDVSFYAGMGFVQITSAVV